MQVRAAGYDLTKLTTPKLSQSQICFTTGPKPLKADNEILFATESFRL
jgi:hypothetical protein